MTPTLVLASASPRRSELLNQIGIRHSIKVVDVDLPVLAADTCVVYDGEIMGKPDNEQHAITMLSKLSGRIHEVYSAVSLRGHQHWQAISISKVKFRPLSHKEISAYWQTGEPCDKAGAYAIQGLASVFIESIEGSFSGVMGLPLFETAQLLAKQGIRVIT
jgi:septum formation protein